MLLIARNGANHADKDVPPSSSVRPLLAAISPLNSVAWDERALPCLREGHRTIERGCWESILCRPEPDLGEGVLLENPLGRFRWCC